MDKTGWMEKLIFALDTTSAAEAERFVEELDGVVTFFKVGIILHTAAGPEFVSRLLKKGKKVFLDLKFFDIGETVRDAVKCAADSGVDFLTVHANRQVMESAVEGKKGSRLKVLAVTLLTNLNIADTGEASGAITTEELVLHRAKMAGESGCDGIITSGKEIQMVRNSTGHRLLIVTPGVRPAGVSTDGHKRFVTPFEAIKAGADYLVVGRPIKNAPDPRQAAAGILKEIESALE
ncbi:MAG TPA: orotidine-5'-phosphate decarboxylase [bacterium]|nr:orotidine-5'-phosphate decarboxylase [bacterium]